MAVVQIGGKNIAVGLNWVTLPGEAHEDKELAAISKKTGMRYGAICRSTSVIAGFCPSSANRVPCGAAWIAKAREHSNDDLVLVEPIGAGEVWFCVVRKGEPVRDLLIAEQEIDEHLTEAMEYGPISVYSRDGFVMGSAVATLFDLVDETEPVIIRQIAGPRAWMLATLIVGSVAVVTAVAWMRMHTIKQQEMADIAAAALGAKQEAELKSKLERFEAESRRKAELEVRAKVLDAASPRDMVQAWWGAVGAIPSKAAGWSLKDVDCSQTKCDLYWARSKWGTHTSFLSYAATHGWGVPEIDGNKARITVVVQPATRQGLMDKIPSSMNFMPTFETQLQEMEVAAVGSNLKPAERVMPEIPPEVAQDPALKAKFNASWPWRIGGFAINGSRIFEIRDIPDYIGYDNVSVLALKINLGSSKWLLEGNYAISDK